jgi:hypothetical protein
MNRAIVALLIPLAMTAACGGGDSAHPSSQPPSANMKIDPGNAALASAVAWRSASGSGQFASLAGGGIASNGGGVSKPAPQNGTNGIVSDIVNNAPFGPITNACAVSGTLTVSGDLASPLTLTAGDTIRAEYEACDDGAGEIVDGRVDATIEMFSGDILSGSYDVTMQIGLTDLDVTTGNDHLLGNGDATATLDTTAAPFVSTSVTGDSLASSTNGSSATLSAFSSEQTVDAGLLPAPYTLDAAGTLDSSELSGVVHYSTPVTFEGDGVDFPHAGELLVTGANCSARLVAIDNVNVKIEVDSDGDGMVDQTIDTTWAELTAL